jgi:3-hydroxybutyryl-CoA dehydratase
MMAEFYVRVGQQVDVAKTVGETDVYLFAGITGDLSSNHVNEQVMAGSSYGHRIAQGALLVGFMSAASTRMIETYGTPANGEATAVSLGYDRVRFLRPVYIGDTITVRYRIAEVDPARNRSIARVVVCNQQNEEVAVADHILKWVPNDAPRPDAAI